MQTMSVIEVIPIAKGFGAGMGSDTFSYFTSKEVPVGALVDVPVRSKTVSALVTAVRPVVDIKAEIKQAPYALRKVDKLNTIDFLSPAFIRAAESSALHYATSLGNVLNTLLPEYLLKNASKLKTTPYGNVVIKKPDAQSVTTTPHLHEIYAVQGDDEERYSTWKSLIRQEFAKKSSVIFVTPTVEDAKHSFTLVEKGIEGYAFLLHSGLSKKEIIATWNTIMTTTHSVAIVLTGGFLSLSRPDISTMIIEKENARGYKSQRRPYLDVRQVATAIAREEGLRLFLGDILLRAETLSAQANGEIVDASPFKFRSLSTASDHLIDMRAYKNQKGSFKILSDETEALITRTKNNSEHMLIYATRRGVAPTTVCGDCQNIVTCNNCSAPVVLHKAKTSGTPFFLCHHCGERRSTEEYCKTCGGWKLGTVGIGIDLVEEKIKDKFPDITIVRIDADTTPTEKLALAAIAKFHAKPGSILLGTEMMLSYVHDRVENAAVISMDSLLALPDFRIQEKILYTLIRIRALTTREFIVQTRKVEERLFDYALKGNLSDFYRLTLEERERFKYPPFTTLIKLTLEGKRDHIVAEMNQIQQLLEPYIVDIFPAFTHTIAGNHILHGLIRIPASDWPQIALIEKLRSLPPSVTIKVDPESLL